MRSAVGVNSVHPLIVHLCSLDGDSMNLKRLSVIVIVFILLVSGVVSIALYKVGDRVFDEVIEQALAAEIEDEYSNSSASGEAIPAGAPEKQSNDIIPMPTPESVTANIDDRQKQEPTPTPIAPEAASTTGQSARSGGEEVKAVVEPQITKEKIENIKEEVTAADKMSMATLVFKKLSQEDIAELTKMAAGGITDDEKEKMKRFALEKFTEEEIKEIKGMYYKYMD